MKVAQTAVFTVTLVILFTSSNGLICRSGFNTSIFDIPIGLWDENASCSSTSSQSCFLGEVTLDTSFIENDITLTYGSCISAVYDSTLECNTLYYGPNGLDVGTLLAIVPDLQEQLDNIIAVFSVDAAESVVQFLRNENGELDSLKVAEAILNAANVTIPGNVRPVVTKFDSFILTLILNQSEYQSAADELLSSFSGLGTPDAAASNLLYALFNRTNIPVPDTFKPAIDNLPGFIAQYINDLPNYHTVNDTLFNIISQIGATPRSAGNVLAAILNQFVPTQYNLGNLFDTLPDVMETLAQGNFENLTTLNLDLFVAYSTVDSYTKSLSDSIFRLITRLGLEKYLTPETNTTITYFPGYFYNFFQDEKPMLQMVYSNISHIIDAIDSNNLNNAAIIESVVNGLRSAGLPDEVIAIVEQAASEANSSDPVVSIESSIAFLNGLLPVEINEDTFGLNALPEELRETLLNNIQYVASLQLELLKGFSRITPATSNFSSSVNNFLQRFGLLRYLTEAQKILIEYQPGISYLFVGPDPSILEDALYNISRIIDSLNPSPNMDFSAILELYGIDTSSDIMRSASSSLNALFDLISTQNVTQFGIASLSALKEASVTTTSGDQMANSVIAYLTRLGVPLDSTTEEVINSIPGAFIGAFPQYEELINTIYSNISQNLDLVDPSNIDYQGIILSSIQSLSGLLPAEVQGIVQQLAAQVNFSDPVNSLQRAIDLAVQLIPEENNQTVPVLNTLPELLNQILQGNYEYLTTWSVELLKSYSRITPGSSRLSNAIFGLAERFGVAGNLTTEIRTVITYQVGYFYQLFSDLNVDTSYLDYAFGNISQAIENIGPDSPVDLQGLLSVLPESTLPAEVKQLIPIIEGFVGVASTGDINAIGMYALEALKNFSDVTTQSAMLSDSVIALLEMMNVTLTNEYKEIITYFPGIISAAYPGQVDTLNAIFANVSEGLASVTTMNFGTSIEMLLNQLETAGITFSDTAKSLIIELPTKINVSDPVGTLESLIQVSKAIVPSEYSALFPLLDTLPHLMKELLNENISYIASWQIELLRTYSNETEATKFLSDSIINLITNFGFSSILTDPVVTWIRFQPGHFYQYFPNRTAEIDEIFYGIAAILQSIDPARPSIQVVLGLIPANTTQVEFIVPALDEFLKEIFTSGGNATQILEATVVLVQNISQNSTAGTELGESILALLGAANVPIPQQLQDIIKDVPGVLLAFFPNQTGLLKSIYESTSQGIVSTIAPFSIEKTIQYTLEQLKATGLSVPTEVVSLANTLQVLLDAAISSNVTAIDQWLDNTLPLVTSSTALSSSLADSIRHVLRQIEGFEITEGVSAAIDYMTTVPFYAVSKNDTVLQSVYTVITENLMKTNITAFDPSSVNGAFANLAMIVPVEIRPLVTSTEDLIISAAIQNMTALSEWGTYLQNVYCISNEITRDFSKAIFDELVDTYAVPIQASFQSAFECVPGILYKFLPNDTVTLDTVFQQVTLGMTNNTALIEIQLQQVGYTLTPENVAMLDLLLEMQAALTNGNITNFLTLVGQLQSLPAPETGLGNLVTTILSKSGVNVTNEIASSIRQATSAVYASVPAQYITVIDAIVSSLNTDLAADIDIGTATKTAFASVNITIPERWNSVLDNAQELVDAITSFNGSRINQAILGIMVSYNASFPSEMLQYSIYQFRLQMAIQSMIETNAVAIPQEVFENAAKMYDLILNMLNTTEGDLRDMLIDAFPDTSSIIRIFFQLDRQYAFEITSKFAIWLANPQRNVTVLANFIREAAEQLLSGLNVDIAGFLRTLAQPISCKYDTCNTDVCNQPSLLDLVDVVRPPVQTTTPTTPEESTITITQTQETTTFTETSEVTATSAVETTTASGRSSMEIFNLNFIVVSTVISSKWLLS